jgi:hypothetical protein
MYLSFLFILFKFFRIDHRYIRIERSTWVPFLAYTSYLAEQIASKYSNNQTMLVPAVQKVPRDPSTIVLQMSTT